MKLTVGARVAVAIWVVIAAIIWMVSDRSAGPSDEFERQVKSRCEELGHEFWKQLDGSLV